MGMPMTLYLKTRSEWRHWLEQNFDKASEAWLVIPKKGTGEQRIPYNDTVEEALCFGWIDSTVRRLDDDHTIQRFSPRQPKSTYSQANKERLRWLLERGLVHASIRPLVWPLIEETFQFPADIIDAIKDDAVAWKHFQGFSLAYQRIRLAFIDGARDRPAEFQKRLKYFINKTRAKKQFGYGGIDKYY